MNSTIRREEERDHRDVENLTREAFRDLYRPGCCEHLIVHKLRTAPAFVRELDCVALDGDKIVGNIMYSKAKVVDDRGQAFEDAELEAFEKGFPYREKHVTDTQFK